MNLTITNLEAIDKAIKSRIDKMVPVFQNALGIEKARIQQRTQSGLDVDNKKFIKYQPRTIKERIRKELKVDPVDLTFSGAMFRAFKLTFSTAENAIIGTLGFGQEAYKVIGNARYDRIFFGLAKSQIETIKEKLRQVS